MRSRYIPFTQQPYCCTPACLQMVMYKNEIPLRAQEDIGYEIGLTVPDEDEHLFVKVRTGEKPPAGWGTQINNPKYEINAALERLNIPLVVSQHLISGIKSPAELKNLLKDTEESDGDAFLCFNYGALWDKDTDSGHVCVFDYLENDEVWLIDPERNVPKNRKGEINKLYQAMKAHGDDKSSGVWVIKPATLTS